MSKKLCPTCKGTGAVRESFDLRLEPEEAWVLARVLASVGGSPTLATNRRYAMSVMQKLREEGYDWRRSDVEVEGTIQIKN